MTGSSTIATVLAVAGRFLYRLTLAIAIVWILGLVVSLLVGDGPGGGASIDR